MFRQYLFIVAIVLGMLPSAFSQEARESPLPAEATKLMSRLIGTWTTEGVRNGTPFTGLYQVRFNEAKSGLIFFSREGDRLSHGVGYWDAATGELVETWIGNGLSLALRVSPVSGDTADGRAVLFLPGGEQATVNTTTTHSEGQFKFDGSEGGGETFQCTFTRVPIEQSEAALANYGQFMVGGTWVCDSQTPAAKHRYTWRPGKTTLVLDRQSGEYPGLTLISVDYASQSVVGQDVDDDGTVGRGTWLQTDDDTWLMYGRYSSESEVQDFQLTLHRESPDELRTSGTLIVNGKETTINEIWKRKRDR